MLRDVIVHISNEQPILADLLVEPKPSDVVLICTNLRTMGGKKPVFIDKTMSTFMLPVAHVRFVEIPQASVTAADAEQAAKPKALPKPKSRAREREVEEEEYAAVPLGRLAWLAGVADEPPSVDTSDAPDTAGPVASTAETPDGEPDEVPQEEPAPTHDPDELDPELLRRIHEV